MNSKKSIHQIIFSALTLGAMVTQMLPISVIAQKSPNKVNTIVTEKNEETGTIEYRETKVAPDLEKKTNDLYFGFQNDETVKVIIQLKSETPLNEMFGNDLNDTEKTAVV